jgi:hypothetical protein
MTDERICPACGEPMPDDDPRRRYCSPSCRNWVYNLGGALAAAELKETHASEWERMGKVANVDAPRFAAENRRQAAILRSYGGNPSRRPI